MKEGDPERQAVRVIITGRVQGVGYRVWTERNAAALGLNGWVRNKRGDGVEAVFAGNANAVKEMIKRCHRGPRAASVENVAVTLEGNEPPEGFNVLPTA